MTAARAIGLLLFVLSLSQAAPAQAQKRTLRFELRHRASDRTLLTFETDEAARAENPRVVGAILAVALGPFGMHRIYFGTDVKVPVFYTLTLGGGMGFLPFIDLLHILFVRDLSYFYDNPRVFMFVGRPMGGDE